ncbi:hypothetical protein [Kineosporia sp. A_224]|uniref:hypothetical protein n=1 Tax=Kineosporia sp. A_224 TaxID=1962180 RepID=UPI000B4B2B99|nr:hypothetical protein [Kineosporia sp. A_224]
MSEGTGPSRTVVEGVPDAYVLPDAYALKDVERRICEDDRITEMGVRLSVRGARIVVQGTVASPSRRDDVLALVRAACPRCPVLDEMRLTDGDLSTPPHGAEVIR